MKHRRQTALIFVHSAKSSTINRNTCSHKSSLSNMKDALTVDVGVIKFPSSSVPESSIKDVAAVIDDAVLSVLRDLDLAAQMKDSIVV